VAEQEELHTTVLEAVNTLSPKNRSATLLFYHEQLSLQEVANRLNISVSAVNWTLDKTAVVVNYEAAMSSSMLQTDW